MEGVTEEAGCCVTSSEENVEELSPKLLRVSGGLDHFCEEDISLRLASCLDGIFSINWLYFL
jgi:hypothetical protein